MAESAHAAGMIATVGAWLSVAEFAELAGINERNGRDVLARAFSDHKPWRGHEMEVRRFNGKAYQVNPATLPPDLFSVWCATLPPPPSPAPEKSPAPAALISKAGGIEKLAKPEHIERAKWEERLIRPALEYPVRSRARGGAIKAIAEREHIGLDGKPCQVAARTLGEWIEKYEIGGLAALVRKPRLEKRPRVFINRAWDAACPLEDAKKTAIAVAVNTYIKSLWASANPGWAKVEGMASSKLMQLCHDAGWQAATYEICRLGRHSVEKHRNHAVIHIKEKDAKRFYDLHKPRIIRDHTKCMPMEIIVGDVHPVDVLVKRPDGSIATPRLIAWYDFATHRIFATLVLLEKGQGITQADVWASFAAMVEAWGLPERLYLDNGSEYDWAGLIRGFNELSALVMNSREFAREFAAEIIASNRPDLSAATEADQPDREAGAIIHALPYNAAAKPIEGCFAALEKVLAMLPGYIGGNRMNKRTHKLGKETEPWCDADSFERAFTTALAYWHTLEQDGNLAGLSPNTVYAGHLDSGWRAIGIPRDALAFALSEDQVCKVHNRGIQVAGSWYYGDALLQFGQHKVSIRYVKWAPERVILVKSTSPLELAWIPRAPVYHATDQTGAAEQSRRNGLLLRHISGMKAETNPLDMASELERHVATQPAAPDTVFGPQIRLGSGVEALVEAGKQMGPAPKQEIRIVKSGEIIHPDTGTVHNLAEHLPTPAPALPRPPVINLADLLPMPSGQPIQSLAESDPFTLPARAAGQR